MGKSSMTTINIATANGTGSQSANLILLQSIFDMGINISGKNSSHQISRFANMVHFENQRQWLSSQAM